MIQYLAFPASSALASFKIWSCLQRVCSLDSKSGTPCIVCPRFIQDLELPATSLVA